MADEEKPTNEEAADQPKAEAIDTSEESGDATDLVDGTQEAIEAITKNVQERAAEIEDVLGDASSPSALVKADTLDSGDAMPPVEQLMEAPQARAQRRNHLLMRTSPTCKLAWAESACAYPLLIR